MVSSILRPEEKVRQGFIKFLQKLGFPESYLLQEKSLSELPHIKQNNNLPNRRVDILAYGQKNGELFPLLLVECKAKKCEISALNQVLGYNHFVGSKYIALVWDGGFVLYNTQTQAWEETLGTYERLIL